MEEVSDENHTGARLPAQKFFFILTGPTASGKTSLSLSVAARINAEIISADSRQVYRELDIGTAKPTLEERRKIPHHFIDIVHPDQVYSAGAFARDVERKIAEIHARSKNVLVVGGSGLYVRAIVDGLFHGPSADMEIRTFLEKKMQHEGRAVLFDELRRVDPISASLIPIQNTHRLIRALEVFHVTGYPISELQKKNHQKPRHESIQIGLAWDRSILYSRINKRVDEMIGRGFLDEVQLLLKKGYDPSLPSLNTVGYKEAINFLRGKIDLRAMNTLMKQHTRNFAKRQLTWFRKDARIHWFALHDEKEFDQTMDRVVEYFLYSR